MSQYDHWRSAHGHVFDGFMSYRAQHSCIKSKALQEIWFRGMFVFESSKPGKHIEKPDIREQKVKENKFDMETWKVRNREACFLKVSGSYHWSFVSGVDFWSKVVEKTSKFTKLGVNRRWQISRNWALMFDRYLFDKRLSWFFISLKFTNEWAYR